MTPRVPSPPLATGHCAGSLIGTMLDGSTAAIAAAEANAARPKMVSLRMQSSMDRFVVTAGHMPGQRNIPPHEGPALESIGVLLTLERSCTHGCAASTAAPRV